MDLKITRKGWVFALAAITLAIILLIQLCLEQGTVVASTRSSDTSIVKLPHQLHRRSDALDDEKQRQNEEEKMQHLASQALEFVVRRNFAG
jgi:hypothetical protein